MDGLTIVLTYRNGVLEKAVTRGNGVVGEVVTNNARVFDNIPHKISFQGELILRGEAIITYSEFEKINEEGNESYSTVSFKDYNKDIAVNYVGSDDMDAVKEHISEMIGLNDGNLTEEGNLTIAETVYGENSVYVFSDNKAVEVSSSKVDLDILKEMAKSVEFED